MWFILSEAISLYIYIYTSYYIYIYQAFLWYPFDPFVGALIEPTKIRSEAPVCANILPDLPGNIGLNGNQTTDQRVTNGNMRNDGRFS